tara:strand:+ start:152 stop:430 length:279 start_codon:yes stop_codon:yes gene_type:complete
MNEVTTSASYNREANEQLPYRWGIRITKVPSNNEEVDSPHFKDEHFCLLNNEDIVSIYKNPVMKELLHYSIFENELEYLSWSKERKSQNNDH